MRKTILIKKRLIILLLFFIGIIFLIIWVRNSLTREVNNNQIVEEAKIAVQNLNDRKIENLSKLCKVWGLVKYHHPKVLKGSINLDNELFKIMPKVLAAKDSEKIDNILYDWVISFGKFKEGEYYNTNEVASKPDLNWLQDDEYINEKLQSLLVKLSKTYISNRDKSYASINYNTGFMEFKSEKAYSDMKYDDDRYKLLSLFRYWNIIQYYFPYRVDTGEDWDKLLREFIIKFINCQEELDYKLAVAELSTKIHDSHAAVMDERGVLLNYFGVNMAPIRFLLVEDKIIVTKIMDEYAKDINIEIGDIILAIDDKDILEVIKEKSKYISFSNDKAIVNDLSSYLFRTNKDSLTLTLERDGTIIKENTRCYKLNKFKENLESHKLLTGNIGYINPGALQKGEIDKIMKEFKETKGVIVDLRYYPSDFIVYSLGGYLIPEATNFVKVAMANNAVPGEYVFVYDGVVGGKITDYYKGKVTVLIDECTQSQGEFTAMSLRNAPKAAVIGSNSIGADGELIEFYLPGGIKTCMTGIGIYNTDKTVTQRVGIAPDIYIKPTINGIREGKDELLDRAIEYINN